MASIAAGLGSTEELLQGSKIDHGVVLGLVWGEGLQICMATFREPENLEKLLATPAASMGCMSIDVSQTLDSVNAFV